MRRLWILALGAYAALLTVIVLAADLGRGSRFFAALADVPYSDKLGHFLLIGLLALLADLAAGRRDARLGRLRAPIAPAIVLCLVVAEELSQRWIATRSFDLGDLAADVLGVATLVGLGRLAASPRAVEVDGASASG